MTDYARLKEPEYYREFLMGVPRKRTVTGALLFCGGKVLVVKPSYKQWWSLPGGVIDDRESPADACARECREELGIDVVLDKLVMVDWVPEQIEGTGDAVHFTLSGPELSERQLQEIKLPREELEGWRLVDADEAAQLVVPGLAGKMRLAFEQGLGFRYFENGCLKWGTVHGV